MLWHAVKSRKDEEREQGGAKERAQAKACTKKAKRRLLNVTVNDDSLS